MGAGLGTGDSYGGYRTRLVEQLQARGIKDLSVLRAIAEVLRHLFVPPAVRHRAYEDSALPLGAGQTISQPWVQARSLELLRLGGSERVLEVGAGSGYQTALIARLAVAVQRRRLPQVERRPAGAGAGRAQNPARPGGPPGDHQTSSCPPTWTTRSWCGACAPGS